MVSFRYHRNTSYQYTGIIWIHLALWLLIVCGCQDSLSPLPPNVVVILTDIPSDQVMDFSLLVLKRIEYCLPYLLLYPENI